MTNINIMIVDDDPDVTSNLSYRLHELGYDISNISYSGEKAVKEAIEYQPDLILMDIVLVGGIDGVEACRQIQEQLQIPVLFMTGHADTDTLHRAKMTKPYGYIFKPFTDRELEAVIETAIYRHRVEKELIEIKQKQQLAYALGQKLTTLLDPQDLLSATVNLLLETFNYYHAHIYLLLQTDIDQDEKVWVLFVQSGTGKAGEKLIQEGHHIRLDTAQSLVAQAARSKKPVAANDVSKDPTHLPNKYLPKTQSEVAVPLLSGKQVLGVLDVQHATIGLFDTDEIQTLQIVAGQLAVALSNARFFSENSRRLAIIENSTDFIALSEPSSGQIIYVNSAGTEMTGYSSSDQLISKQIDTLCPVGFVQNDKRTVWRSETELQRVDGTTLPVEQTCFIIPKNRSRRSMLATMMTDITARKKNEGAIKRYANRLQILRKVDQAILAAQSPAEVATVTLNQVQNLLPCLRAKVLVFDLTIHEAIVLARFGEPDLHIDLRFSINHQNNLLSRLEKGEICRFEDIADLSYFAPYKTILEETGVYSIILAPLLAQEQLIGALILGVNNLADFEKEQDDIVREVADLLAIAIRQAKQSQALKEAEERYHGLFDGVPVGLYRTSPEGHILDANPALVNMLGYPSREALMEVNIFHIYVSREQRKEWQKMMATKKAIRGLQINLRRSDGTTVWAKNSVNVVWDANGEILHYEGALIT